jgi:hypothetical protein
MYVAFLLKSTHEIDLRSIRVALNLPTQGLAKKQSGHPLPEQKIVGSNPRQDFYQCNAVGYNVIHPHECPGGVV